MKYDTISSEFPTGPAKTAARCCNLCDVGGVKPSRAYPWILAVTLAAASLPVYAQQASSAAQSTNAVARTGSTNRSSTTPARTDRQSTRSSAATATTASSGQLNYAAFQTIAERNIFNGSRTGARIRENGIQRPSVRVDGFSLVGTVESEKGLIAFFDGTEPSYKSTAKPGTKIGGFEVKEVRFAGVRLAQGTETIDLAVGSGMRRENSGPWKSTTDGTSLVTGGRTTERASVTAANSYTASTFSDTGGRNNRNQRNFSRGNDSDMWGGMPTTTPMITPTTTSSSSGASASPVDVNDVLKRLMEQREKE